MALAVLIFSEGFGQDLYTITLFSGDVCDDREQLAAIFDKQNGGHYHGGGDGMSLASD